MKLKATFVPAFSRDLKRIGKRGLDERELLKVIDLILENTPAAIDELCRRHRMHTLVGKWKGNNECHVANAGDWLIVWKVCDGVAFFQRTGSHDEIFSSRPPLK